MKPYIPIFLFLFLSSNWGFSKSCPKVNFSECPEDSICKKPTTLKGKKLKALLKDLEKTEYSLPWTIKYENELTLTTKFFGSFRKLQSLLKKTQESIKKEMKKYKETERISKELTENSFKLSEKLAFQSYIKPVMMPKRY